METVSKASKSIKNDSIQYLNAVIDELKNELHTVKRDNTLEVAYLELVQSHVELKQKYEARQYILEQKRKELGDLRLRNNELSAKIRGILAHQDTLYQKYKPDTAHVLKKAIAPIVKKMKNSGLDALQYRDLEALESAINDTLFPVIKKTRQHLKPLEIDIARLIKEGKKQYEIAEILDIPQGAAKNARYRIRRKLGLVKQKTNLKKYLETYDINEHV